MTMLTRLQIEAIVIPEWKEKIERALPDLLNIYPGGNIDLLGRQLISKLNLKAGMNAMKQGVLYQIIGSKPKERDVLTLYVLQPFANTEIFELDLTYYENLFIKRKNEEWNK